MEVDGMVVIWRVKACLRVTDRAGDTYRIVAE
jgi:hypothetical protein